MQQKPTAEKLDFNKIWSLFLETDSKFKETELMFKETDKKFLESREQILKTEQVLNEKFRETDRQMKNLMKKMAESENRWGRFVESLVEGALIRLLKGLKIKV